MSEPAKPASAIKRFSAFLRNGPRAIKQRGYDAFHRRETGAPVWKYSEITPQIFVGGQHTKQGYAEMREFGITAIVNMREATLLAMSGKASAASVTCTCRPSITRRPASKTSCAAWPSSAPKSASRADAKVYIHCAAGCGRAPTMAAAYLISNWRRAPREAWNRIKRFPPLH